MGPVSITLRIRPPKQGGCHVSVILSASGQVKPGRRGTNIGLYASAWEFEDVRRYAKVQQALATEPEGQAIATQGQATDAPSILVSDTVWNEIPL